MGVKNLFFAGVGGQGLVLSNQIQARAALRAGFDVKTSDIYGLAMRGGSVYGYQRFGVLAEGGVLSSTFPAGAGDVLVSFEPLEALRWAHLMRRGARAVVNASPVYPSAVLLEKAPYPRDVVATLAGAGLEVTAVDAQAIALRAGSAKLVNVALLGALARELPEVGPEHVRAAIRELVPAAMLEANLKAFELAYAG
ncbi:MAG TPA: indolepyruvate oxidoreductase subunit beta [Myxococcota bacterium]|nr:indolepyruvate oxidoreductase subunit beta [Myxococcota bacterium]HRY92022.1 indolepyruvate oxidoreductase subunit beta [Myxococcota bacterium]HSA23398.1 indolepyruvate oxidoreductase subunit beta [Myxococcota bacterium]